MEREEIEDVKAAANVTSLPSAVVFVCDVQPRPVGACLPSSRREGNYNSIMEGFKKIKHAKMVVQNGKLNHNSNLGTEIMIKYSSATDHMLFQNTP